MDKAFRDPGTLRAEVRDWTGYIHRHFPVLIFVHRRRYDALPFVPLYAWWGPRIGLTENLVERFEVIRIPVDDAHRHASPFAMLEVIVTVRDVFLVTRVPGRFARRGRHCHRKGESGRVYGQNALGGSRTSDAIVGNYTVYTKSRDT